MDVFLLLYVGPFIIGMAMRYASQRWCRALLVTFCLIFVIFILVLISSSVDYFGLEVRFFASMILGAVITDLIYRIRRRRKE